jgi:flavin reductase (DIM6/NTAB) family NADH-FMN oxidoreductase RutF
MQGEPMNTEMFKQVMANVAQSVTVVTTNTPDGPVGLTVSAFTSVSADPPIVLVCIDKAVGSLEPLLAADGYTVNIMPQGTEHAAMVFATPGADRFGTVAWHEPETVGAGPVLVDAFQFFECVIVERTEIGDHWVIYGEVIHGRAAEGLPLVYLNREFIELPR